MKNRIITKNKFYKFIITGLVFIILSVALIDIVWMQVGLNNQERESEAARRYAMFEGQMQTFLISNEKMIAGFAAYIQTYNNYQDEEVYNFLGYLMDENSDYIRNIGIIKDTTIVWNYPVSGNEKALGTDLSKIPEQAVTIDHIKKTMTRSFDGPVNLVQGGTGYTMRIPIKKDNIYWGMVSIVLKPEAMDKLIGSFATKCGIELAIENTSKGNLLIYGNKKIQERNPFVFHSSFEGTEWTAYVIVNDSDYNSDMDLVILIGIMGLLFIVFATYSTFKLLRVNEEIEREKDSLSEAVMTDTLTGIHSRNYFDTRIVEETQNVDRYGGNLSMIYFDLDHFKMINDTYGHAYGDRALRDVAVTVKDNLRSCDIFARWGGEEFVILMPETDLDEAAVVAEKLRAAIQAMKHPNDGILTASFGVAQYFREEFIDNWFNRVDRALYDSKTGGRNRVSKSDINSGE